MNNGYQNEYDFVKLFNNKYLNELDQNSIQFLYELFGEKIKMSLLQKIMIISIKKNIMDLINH